MDQILELMKEYRYVGVVGLLVLQMIILFCMVHMIRKLNKYVRNIHQKVQEYMQVVLDEGDSVNDESDPQRVISEQEKQMVDTITDKKKQQEEAVFNAVLQEIFP